MFDEDFFESAMAESQDNLDYGNGYEEEEESFDWNDL